MKNFINNFLILSFIALNSCDIPVTEDKPKQDSISSEYPIKLHDVKYTVYEPNIIYMDSCEYIAGHTISYHGGPVLTHRGRCKFCIARNKQH